MTLTANAPGATFLPYENSLWNARLLAVCARGGHIQRDSKRGGDTFMWGAR